MSGLPEMLTVQDVSSAMKRSPRWVRENYIRTGKVRFIRPNGGGYLIYADSLRELLDFDGARQKSEEYYQREALEAMRLTS